MAMNQAQFNQNLVALPALLQGAAAGGNGIANAAALKTLFNQIKTDFDAVDAAAAAALRAAGGLIPPGSYDGQYITLAPDGQTVIKPANFTTWVNDESLFRNFDGTQTVRFPSGNVANATLDDNLSLTMFASVANLNYALSYYPDNNNRIKLPKLVTENVRGQGYTDAITALVNGAAAPYTQAMVPAATVAHTDEVIGNLEAPDQSSKLKIFSPHPTGVSTCVSTRTGRADLGTCPTLSPADAANLSVWGVRTLETNVKTSWATPPNFLHYTDIKLAEGARYNDIPNRFQVARTTTDNSAVLIVTCEPAPRGFFSRQRIDPNHTSFIDYDKSNFILPSGWRISRRLYDGMIVYTSPENITQTFFPDGTFHKPSGNNKYVNRPFLTACAMTALAKLSNATFNALDQQAKFRAAEFFCCVKLANRIRNNGFVLGGGSENKIPRLHFKKSYKNHRRTKNKNRNKSKSMSMFKSAKRAFYRTNKRNNTSKKY
jgi:hypothetical protein